VLIPFEFSMLVPSDALLSDIHIHVLCTVLMPYGGH
jgi:hypothetical protein